MAKRVHLLRRLVMRVLLQVRCEPARKWLLQHLSIIAGKEPIWADRFNVKKVIGRIRHEDFELMEPRVLAQGAGHPELQAHGGPWKLPVWPNGQRVRRTLQASWRDWAQKNMLHPRVSRRMHHLLAQQTAQLPLRQPPPRWQEAEEHLREVFGKKVAVTWDDRDMTKAWAIQKTQIWSLSGSRYVVGFRYLAIPSWFAARRSQSVVLFAWSPGSA